MNWKTLCSIISGASVVVMLIWGFIAGSFEHSWLAVFAGGIAVGIISSANKQKEKQEAAKAEQNKIVERGDE